METRRHGGVVGQTPVMKPLLWKAGMVVTMSFAGYFLSQLRSRKAAVAAVNPHRRPLLSNSDAGEADGGRATGGGEHKKDLRFIGHEEASPNFTHGSIPTSMLGFPYRIKPPQEEMGYFLTQFDELVNEEFGSKPKEPDKPSTLPNPENKEALDMKQEITALRDTVHSLQEKEREFEAKLLEYNTLKDTLASAQHVEVKEKIDMKQEIVELKKSIQSLQEEEKILEMQLLEYNNFKDQEAVVKELENHLEITSKEAEIHTITIESLQNENQRLKDQMSVYSKVLTKLRSSRAKIRLLKRKLRTNSTRARKKMASLYCRIAALQDRERANQRNEEDREWNLNRLKDLEDEVIDLERENSRLSKENLDLTIKLESNQMITSTNSVSSEESDAMEEASRSRQQNSELMKEIEQLRTDQCTDVEQLVYLKWINACLRYELRNHQPTPGKVAASSLSKNLSLKSAEKAKELILEYAHSEDDDKISVELDPKYSSSSQSSSRMETREVTADASTTTKNKPKFLGKIKRLVLRKDTKNNKIPASDNTLIDQVSSERSNRLGTNAGSFDGPQQLSLSSEEAMIARCGRCRSDVGCSSGYERIVSSQFSSTDTSAMPQLDTPEKMELKKFADALKNSTSKSPLHRSLSFSVC